MDLTQATQQALATWEKNKKKSKRLGNFIRVRIALMVLLGPPAVLFGAVSVPDLPAEAQGFQLIAILASGIAALLLTLQTLSLWSLLGTKPRISEEDYQHVRCWPALMGDIESLLAEVGLSRDSVVIELRVFEFSNNLGIRRRGDKHYLALRLGFLAAYESDREAAQAMLAHEIAHIAQGDTQSWELADAFSKLIVRIVLPWNIIAFLAASIGLLPIASNLAVLLLGLTINSLGLMIPFAFFQGVRNGRRRSEYMADLAAAILTSREAMLRVLRRQPDIKQRFLSVHPTPAQRIAALLKSLPEDQIRVTPSSEEEGKEKTVLIKTEPLFEGLSRTARDICELGMKMVAEFIPGEVAPYQAAAGTIVARVEQGLPLETTSLSESGEFNLTNDVQIELGFVPVLQLLIELSRKGKMTEKETKEWLEARAKEVGLSEFPTEAIIELFSEELNGLGVQN